MSNTNIIISATPVEFLKLLKAGAFDVAVASKYCVGLLDEKPGFEIQARH